MTDKIINISDAKRKRGRPRFNWTDDTEEEILSLIIAGQSVRQICNDRKDDKTFPSADLIYQRIAADEDFYDKYTRARELQQDTYAEEIIAIADDVHPFFANKSVEERKLAIENRKWTMGKLRPKKYNEKIITEITGADGSPLIPTQMIDVAELTDEAREGLRFALLAASSRNDAEDINEEGDTDG